MNSLEHGLLFYPLACVFPIKLSFALLCVKDIIHIIHPPVSIKAKFLHKINTCVLGGVLIMLRQWRLSAEMFSAVPCQACSSLLALSFLCMLISIPVSEPPRVHPWLPADNWIINEIWWADGASPWGQPLCPLWPSGGVGVEMTPDVYH